MKDHRSLDEQQREFYQYVGVAITEWAHVDEELFNICVSALKCEKHLAAIVYYRINTIYGRLLLVDELITTVFPKPERKDGGHVSAIQQQWIDAKKLIDDELSRRNQLAHCPLGPMVDISESNDPEKPFAITDIWYASYVSGSERLRGKATKKDLTIADVKNHIQQVNLIVHQVREFRRALAALP